MNVFAFSPGGFYRHFVISLSQAKKTFEMKLNISGTELVVLENVKTLDTHAVVLKVCN